MVALARDFPGIVKDVSGRGLLLALHAHTAKQALAIITHCVGNGVVLMAAFLDRTRILIEPPLCITDAEMAQVVLALHKAVQQAGLLGNGA